MIVGKRRTFAIESAIIQAFANPSLMAIGFFNIFLNGRRFGVRESDATMLACSYDEVIRRVERRGLHVYPSLIFQDGHLIADAYAKFREGPLKLSCHEHSAENILDGELLNKSEIAWAPDGDAAFDDGSYVLQFDHEHSVRLIAFKTLADGELEPESLADKWMEAPSFYNVLSEWANRFSAEWSAAEKQRERF